MLLKPIPPDFLVATWKEMSGQGMMHEATEVHKLPDAHLYRLGGHPQTDANILESKACEALAEQAWKSLTDKAPSKGYGLVVLKALVVASIRYGMYIQRRAQERGDLL